MTVLATICARGGSVGVPGKNIRLMEGKPLIAYTIEQALACAEIDRVVVSTDAEDIAAVARRHGAEVPFLRPAHLATSAAGKLPVIEHLVTELEAAGENPSMIVDLQPTTPLREVEDITACISLLDDDVDVVITGFESDENPYFNMVEYKPDGHVGLVKSAGQEVLGRQGAPRVYAMNGAVYVWHRHSLDKGLWGGSARLYAMPRERSVDIDNQLDWDLASLLMSRKLAATAGSGGADAS